MLINMQTKFVYIMFYNSVLNSYVVNFIILQSQGEKKLLCILSYVWVGESTLFWIWDVGFLDGWEVGFDAIGSYIL